MRVARTIALGALLVVLTSSLGYAQDKKVHVNIGGGPTFIAGDLGEHFGMGWGPAFGVTYDFNPHFGAQFEYAFRWFDIKDDAPFFGATRFSANHKTHQLDFNFVANLTPSDSAARVYIVAGPGVYNREVEITEYVGNGIICDPWYYVCGTYPIEAIIGSRGGWDFGFNAGGGVGFKIGDDAEFYVESRYHYVMGPEVNDTAQPKASGGGSANGTYYPLTFGFRF